MFWSRGAREARRQKVLDELMELDPADRRLRLQQAVVARDVRSSEVDQALRLVARLDALRVMTLPPADGMSHRLLGGGSLADSEPAPVENVAAEPADWSPAFPSRERRAEAEPPAELLVAAVDVAVTVHIPEPVAVPIETPEATAFGAMPDAAAELEPLAATPERPSPAAWPVMEPMPLDAVESATRYMSRPRPPRAGNAQVRVALSDLRPSSGPDERAQRPDISWLREI